MRALHTSSTMKPKCFELLGWRLSDSHPPRSGPVIRLSAQEQLPALAAAHQQCRKEEGIRAQFVEECEQSLAEHKTSHATATRPKGPKLQLRNVSAWRCWQGLSER